MRALQVYMVDMIATEYEAKCSALNVVEAQHHTLAGWTVALNGYIPYR